MHREMIKVILKNAALMAIPFIAAPLCMVIFVNIGASMTQWVSATIVQPMLERFGDRITIMMFLLVGLVMASLIYGFIITMLERLNENEQ